VSGSACGWGWAAAAPAAASSLQDVLTLRKQEFLRRALPLCRNQQTKNSAMRHAEPLADGVSNQQVKFC